MNIVSVVYAEEIPFLRNQARSLREYFNDEDVQSICIIVNDRKENECVDRVHAMLPLYGTLRDRVRIIRPADILSRNSGARRNLVSILKRAFVHKHNLLPLRQNKGWKGNHGWLMQQALKLCISRIISDNYILILDCKNFFVKPVTSRDFVSPSGRPKSNLDIPSSAQRSWIERSFEIFGIPAPDLEEPAAPSTTPFCIQAAVLRDCLDQVESRVGPIEAYFGYRPFWARGGAKASEFMLIYAYVTFRFGNWLSVFDRGLQPAASINRKMDDETVERMIELVEHGKNNVFSVHKSRLQNLQSAHVQRIKRILDDRNLEFSDLFF